MNRKEAVRIYHQEQTLQGLGFTAEEARALRRISMTLQRWYELECGNGNGCIERSEDDGKPYWRSAYHSAAKPYRIPDRETGARKRLAKILSGKTGLSAYVQTDPRGAALYILRPGDVPEGADVSAYYSRGVCIY